MNNQEAKKTIAGLQKDLADAILDGQNVLRSHPGTPVVVLVENVSRIANRVRDLLKEIECEEMPAPGPVNKKKPLPPVTEETKPTTRKRTPRTKK